MTSAPICESSVLNNGSRTAFCKAVLFTLGHSNKILFSGHRPYQVVRKLLLLRIQQGPLPVAHAHILARRTRTVNMAILNASNQIEGVRLEQRFALYNIQTYFSIQPYLDDGVKSAIAMLAKSLNSTILGQSSK